MIDAVWATQTASMIDAVWARDDCFRVWDQKVKVQDYGGIKHAGNMLRCLLSLVKIQSNAFQDITLKVLSGSCQI